jgi:general stress protein YciG
MLTALFLSVEDAIMAEKGRGFAAMDQAKQREIASRGGRAAHQRGTAHQFTVEEAAAAGRKGGQSVSKNREHMAQIGRKGGLAAHNRDQAAADTSGPGHANQPNSHVDHAAPMKKETAQQRLNEPEHQEPEVLPVEPARIFHNPTDTEALRDDADWDSEELLEEGRMGNENAIEEHNAGQPNETPFEAEGANQRNGGHGYGSFEEERSPQLAGRNKDQQSEA